MDAKKQQSVKISNKNTLYITSKSLTYAGVKEYVSNLIRTACEKAELKVKKSFYINNPKDRNGDDARFCYVWIDSVEVVNVILGFNPDGSERIKRVPIEVDTDDWFAEDFENVKLDPIMVVPGYGPDREAVFVGYAEAYLIDGKSTDTIMTTNLPHKITQEDIRQVFSRYNTRDDKRYPLVSINKQGTCTIKFHPGTHDAVFALQMMLFFPFKGETLKFYMPNTR
jgi:hypothetical protein